ncbi:hypothetical protein HXX76_009937 [Chlamydomonas incerta]|uniref:Uncharacterized protein n=1 Tax=Chlamydomonas incerta TaxID=51695 RepID=A0A835SS59_CHLIN|nr:hypothetical protein HXX76_009937 [Chlamydomonas incerta]|eukprot:KAG2430412.1 hypothetical protein HXX76_009937 [Chlamydomonas incerta]
MRARTTLALRCVQQCSQIGSAWSQISSTYTSLAHSPVAHGFGSVDTSFAYPSRATGLTLEATPAALLQSFASSGVLIHSSEGDDDGI